VLLKSTFNISINCRTKWRRHRQHVWMMYSVSQKIPPGVFWQFFSNGWEFLVQIVLTHWTFQSTLDYKFLSNYLQFWRSYAILSATTQFTPHFQNVHPSAETYAIAGIFWHFPQTVRNFLSKFYTPITLSYLR